MIEPSTLLSFTLTTLGLLLIPGPDYVLVASSSLIAGRRGGLASAAGILSGELLHTALAAAGLLLLLSSSPQVFSAVRLAGAAYLAYLALRTSLGGRVTAAAPGAPDPAPATLRPGLLYGQALATNVLSPATAAFFVALLPQFVQPASGAPGLQVLTLGGIYMAMDAAMMLLLVLLTGVAQGWLRRAAPRAANRAGPQRLWRLAKAGLLLGMGLRLAFPH